ncbi:hypothetical protein GGI20_003630 [Coemansia sp. BCRC 34301]|nr:hypothetical protein GGI20_003630 [Coemansia sp. BCRC 34301]
MDEAKDTTPPSIDDFEGEQVTVPEPHGLSLKQIYGMLCWLQVGSNSKRWQEEPLAACVQAVSECPHLATTDASQLCAQMESINRQSKMILADHGGDSKSVPQDTRIFPGGPLFSIVDYALSGHCLGSSLVEAHGAGNSLMERAKRLTPEEISQMRDELRIRREIAIRDALLLADWTALKRRELEIKEMKLRALVRSNRIGSIESLLQFEEYVNNVLRDGI